MNFSLVEKLGEDSNSEEEAVDLAHFTDWGSIISNVKECLPTIDSDSEVSALTESSDNDPIVFSRKVEDKLSPIPSKTPDSASSIQVSTSSVLFERLQCQNHTFKSNGQDLEGHCDDLDLPIYDNEVETAVGYSCLDENGNHVIDNESKMVSTDTELAMERLSSSSVGKTRLLCSEVLETYSLDEVLENVEENDEIVDKLENCRPASEDSQGSEKLMDELVNLSRKQSGFDEAKPDVTEKVTSTSRGVTADLPLHGIPETMLPKVITSLSPKLAELSWSEPTTIYLDLRSKPLQPSSASLNSEETNTEVAPGSHELTANGARQSFHGVTSSTHASSESDGDDFEEWKRLRRRFKSGSCHISFDSHDPHSNAGDITSTSPSPENSNAMKGSSAPCTLAEVPESSSRKLKEFAQLLVDPQSEESKCKLRNIALQKVNEIKKKIRDRPLTHKQTNINEERADGVNLNLLNSPIESEGARRGMYASQRLKNTDHESGDTDIPNSVAKNKSYGKATVLFAEEPKQDGSDTMNIYRSRKMNESAVASIQTNQSSSIREDQRRSTDSLSCSTSDLKAAVHKLVEEKKQTTAPHSGDRSPKQWTPSSARDSYSILQKQRKQPALSMSSHSKSTTDPPLVPSEVKDKLRSNLQRMYVERFSHEERKIFPLLFDKEITFERELSMIPDRIDVEMQSKMVLLTFQMSSPGCVVMNRSVGSHRFVSVDSSSGLSITYALLISWLLALIPDNLDKPHDPPCEDVFTIYSEQEPDPLPEGVDDNPVANIIEVPFNVVSLHQIWQEETQTIATNALVIPNFFYKPDTNNRRKKPKKENAFLQVVWHFLQSNRIQEVCPWYARPESPILYNTHEMQLTCATKPMSTYITATNDPHLLRKALDRKPGFMWKLVKNDDNLPPIACPINQLQTTVCLLQQDAFTYPVCLLDLVLRLQSSCLDIASLRLVYTTRKFLQKNTLAHMDTKDPDKLVPCVALAIRGKSAIKKMLSIIGPRDPVLAAMTDEGSLNGIYGQQLSKRRGDSSTPTEMNVFHSPRGCDRAQQLLITWFSGRFGADECRPYMGINNSTSNKSTKGMKANRKSNGSSPNFTSKKATIDFPKSSPQTGIPFLVASNPSRICLIVSARFPPHYLGDIITVVSEQGFVIEGMRRMTLNDKKVSALCIPSRFVVYFKPPSNPDVTLSEEYYEIDNWWLRPVTILTLSRENSSAHQSGLISNIQSELMYRMIHPQEEGHLRNVTNQCFHVIPYTDAVIAALGSMHKTPDIELPSEEIPRIFYSDPELEQVVVLSLLGAAAIAESGKILITLLHGEFTIDDQGNPNPISMPPNDNEPEFLPEFQGFELLGIKYIPTLSTLQAKELTPFEVGTKLWYSSLPTIESSPVLMCALRRVNAYHVLRAMLCMMAVTKGKSEGEQDVTKLMSPTPEIAYRQIRMFFSPQELFSDNRCRPLLKYLPPPIRIAQHIQSDNKDKQAEDASLLLSNHSPKCFKRKKKDLGKRKETAPPYQSSEESVLSFMLSWPRPLFSVLIVKPDAFPRHFVKILKRIHKEGFTVVAARMSVISDDQAYQIVPSAFEKMPGEQRIFVSHMTSGPSLVLCVQRDNAVRKLIELAGPSNPRDSRHRDNVVGKETWRTEFGIDEFSNAIHVSERYVSACEEQKLFFPEGLCCCETVELNMEQIPTPALDHVMCQDKMKGREVKSGCDVYTGVVSMSGMEMQPICVIITSPMIAMQQRKRGSCSRVTAPPYVDVMEQLMTQGYELCALRMCWLRMTQANFLYDIIESRAEKKQRTIDNLTTGPCLVMLLQRENGLLLFDSIIGSCLKQHSYQKHGDDYLRTQTTAQTHQAARFAFHRLENRHSVFQIIHKRALEWKTHESY